MLFGEHCSSSSLSARQSSRVLHEGCSPPASSRKREGKTKEKNGFTLCAASTCGMKRRWHDFLLATCGVAELWSWGTFGAGHGVSGSHRSQCVVMASGVQEHGGLGADCCSCLGSVLCSVCGHEPPPAFSLLWWVSCRGMDTPPVQ